LKKKILFISPYPHGIGPSQRFRFEQYLDFLSEYFDCNQQTFWDKRAWDVLFKEGKVVAKFYFLIRAFFSRIILLFSISKYDLIFIHREMAHIGPPIFEWFVAKILKKNIVYDFDDAIWNLNYSNKNPLVKYFKATWKVAKICKWATAVSCGNQYLSNFAKQYNKQVFIIPTTIDTNYHQNIDNNEHKLTIGWTGTLTTLKHINVILPVLRKLEKKYDFDFRVIANDKPQLQLDCLEYVKWKKESEIEDLSVIDVGLMPLPNEEWEKGKCGFKGLQYMALSIPTVMSPVGVNNEIIRDGENGFLASSENEWIDKISQLIESKTLREKLGKAGRRTVVDTFSVEANKQKYLDLFNFVLSVR